ncbi:MAG: hypothetical protein JSU63_21175 [Phycisphaerales bacterium]|nr:MAG: hypothetical protein JSU63_21175 [Phycisphaerales bacterium]
MLMCKGLMMPRDPSHPVVRLQGACLSAVFAALTCGQGPPPPSDGSSKNLNQAIANAFGEIVEWVSDSDWEEEHPLIEQSLKDIWERNSWDDEADIFARELVREVSAIPPWKMAQRIELACQLVSQRYDFSPQQSTKHKAAVVREFGGFLARHAGTVFNQVSEVVQLRMQGKPFTSEQVARWTQDSEPLVSDARAVVDRILVEMEPTMDSQQREILKKDMKAFEKRWRVLQNMRAEWARGEWEPEHWGLGSDPIHRRVTSAAIPGAQPRRRQSLPADRAVPSAEPRAEFLPIPEWTAHNPTTWFAYVLEMQKRYKLDAGQISASWSIHAETVGRAKAYILAHSERLSAVPATERSTHEAYEPVRSYFEELRNRLDAVPTTGQRETALP